MRKMLGSLGMLGAIAPEDRTGMCDKPLPEESERLPDLSVLSTDCGMNCHKQCKDRSISREQQPPGVCECGKRGERGTGVGRTFLQ